MNNSMLAARATMNMSATTSTPRGVSAAGASRVSLAPRRTNANVMCSAGKGGKAGKKEAPPPRTLAENLSFEDGIFAPAVRISIAVVGLKDLNKLRGKAIALHSQVITSFCKQVGAPPKTKQGLIRLAKKNGHKLGFLVTEPAW